MSNKATIAAVILGAGLALSAQAPAAAAPPASSFTYQGSLSQNGSPVDGLRDMRFRLYNTEVGGSPIQTVQAFDIEVTDGIFAAEVSFGAAAFASNEQFWVEIEAGPADQSQSYEIIGRQKLTGTPYALNTRGIHVEANNNITVGATLRLENPAESTWAIFSGSQGRFGIQDTTGPNTRMLIDSVGNVGIGTANPGTRLHIDPDGLGLAPQGQSYLAIARNDSNYISLLTPTDRASGVLFGDARSTAQGGIVYVHTTDYMSFRVDGNSEKMRLTADGRLGIGTATPTTALDVDGAVTIRGGADIVEGFESVCETAFEPGTVLVIDPANPGMLMCAEGAYDKKVAGVVSGAGGVLPGIKLGQDGVMDGDIPVAMTGRVYVKCSAENGSIEAGDLLTTADLAGHAMKATDDARSNGTVIGKAMGTLDAGEGLVLVLVNLQ